MSRGCSKSPEFIVELIKELVDKSSLRAVSNATGIGIAAISRYRNGIGEPTLHTLRRLSDYTGKTFTIEIKPSA